MNRWIKRIKDYCIDKKLSQKCGLEVKDICVHESHDLKFYYPAQIGDKTIYAIVKVFSDLPQRFAGKDYIISKESCYFKCKKCGEFYR